MTTDNKRKSKCFNISLSCTDPFTTTENALLLRHVIDYHSKHSAEDARKNRTDREPVSICTFQGIAKPRRHANLRLDFGHIPYFVALVICGLTRVYNFL